MPLIRQQPPVSNQPLADLIQQHKLEVELVDPTTLIPHPRNVREHPEENILTIMRSLSVFGQQVPIVVDVHRQVIKGNGTLQSFLRLRGMNETQAQEWVTKELKQNWLADSWRQWTDNFYHIQIVHTQLDGEVAETFAIMDNKANDLSHFNMDLLSESLKTIDKAGINLNLTGFKKYETKPLIDGSYATSSGSLVDKFIVPPFSVLDARQGYWQDRKRLWIALGVRSEVGRRDGNLGRTFNIKHDGESIHGNAHPAVQTAKQPKAHSIPGGGTGANSIWKFKTEAGYQPTKQNNVPGGRGTNSIHAAGDPSQSDGSGTSIFDPVLTELSYRWFNIPGGSILDPFAGGSVRGVVAEHLKYKYTGIEIRPEQIEANIAQASKIGVSPKWINGDSLNIKSILPSMYRTDLVFTCPPYFNLETYTQEQDDGSTFKDYNLFIEWYRQVMTATCSFLRNNRFAVVTVGEVRDRSKTGGPYVNFIGDNIRIFKEMGFHYYNEMILVTAVSSLSLRVGKQFSGNRKIGKTHQNVLVFFKGDLDTINRNYPAQIEHADLNLVETAGEEVEQNEASS